MSLKNFLPIAGRKKLIPSMKDLNDEGFKKLLGSVMNKERLDGINKTS